MGADDIANFGLSSGSDKWWYGPVKGQTFTTGNAAVLLKAITYQTTTATVPTKTFVVRVGTVAGPTSTFTQIASETFTQTVAWAANDYVTWTFSTPVLLQSNTVYGIDVGMTNSTTAWQTGIPYLSITDNLYTGGVMYSSGDNGIGSSAPALVGASDRTFHIHLDKPITTDFTLAATSPADNATIALATDPLLATFSRYLTPGTGNITLRNLSDSIDTVIPIGDARISIFQNLLTIHAGSALAWGKSYALRIDPGALVSDTAVSFAGISDDTTWSFTTASSDPLLTAINELKNHITGSITLTADQIAADKLAIDADQNRFATSTSAIAAALDLITTFDSVKGALWVAQSLPARASVTNDLNWTIFNVMQDLMDLTYTATNIANQESLLNGFKFGSSTNFPGACAPPVDPNQTYTATLSASYANTFGRPTQGDGPGTYARKPTGCYLAPGSIATVTVPQVLVGKNYRIRVGAHSWDFTNKPYIKRLDRSTLVYSIDAVQTKIASPLGGGIYIEVPFLANDGVVSVQISNSVRSPYFSAKSIQQTTPAQWLTERTNPGPWTDFQTDKFMAQVPTSWIYAMPDPTQLMADWNSSMDAINDLMGFPHLRGKETMYLQIDLMTKSAVYAPGYPTVNDTYSPGSNYGGYANSYMIRGPQYAPTYTFHEQGHSYFFPKFGGESESNINLLQVAVQNRKFGASLDDGLRTSVDYGINATTSFLDNTAVLWMTSFDFSPRKVNMADWEKAYQPQGHAKFVDIVRLFGWSGLDAFWYYYNLMDTNGQSYPGDDDSRLLQLSISVGKDIRPLFHFWGILPQNPAALNAAIASAGLTAPTEIHDLLLHYRSLVPANNSAYQAWCLYWYGRQPTMNNYGVEKEHARQWSTTLVNDSPQVRFPTEIFDDAASAQVQARVQEIINLYYPDVTPPTLSTLSPSNYSTTVAVGANLVLTFSEAIALGTGNITIKNLTNSMQSTIAVTDSTQVSISGSVLTINPTADLAGGLSYAIRIDAGAITDLATNAFSGIADDTTWTFNTLIPDTNPPTIATLSPTNNASTVALGSNLVATFSEAIALGTGNITLKNLTDATQTLIAVTDAGQVSISGSILTINPATDLVVGKNYAVQIDSTAVKDLSNNFFTGIANDTTWAFTTMGAAVTYTFTPTAAATYPWTTVGNWDGNGVPVSATNTKVTFFSNVTTALANGTLTINTDPSTLTLNALTLNGKGPTGTADALVNIGTAGNTWTFDGTSPTITLSGTDGTGKALVTTVKPSMVLNQNLTITGNGTAAMVQSYYNSGPTFSGNISGNYGITKNGSSTAKLSGSNSYTGGMTLNSGGIYVGSATAFGTGALTIGGNANLIPPYGSILTVPNNVTVNAGFTATFNSYNQYYGMNFGGVLTGDSSTTFSLAGATTLNANGITYDVGLNNTANAFTGTLLFASGSQGGIIQVNSLPDSASPIKMSNAYASNMYAGLQLGSGATAPLVFNSRQIQLTSTGYGALLNANANAANTITVNTDLAITGTGAHTFTLGGANTGANAFNGKIVNGTSATSLTKTNGGTWTLSAANTYTGATTVSGGILSLSAINVVANANPLGQSSSAAGNLLLADGTTLRYTGAAATCDRLFTLNTTANSGTVTLDASGTGPVNFSNTGSVAYGTATTAKTRTLALTGSNTGANTLAASIADNGVSLVAVSKSGAGTWTLTGTHTYSGVTAVSAGTLVVAGSLGATAVTVSSAATLAGNGNIGGNVTISSGAHHALAVAATIGTQATRAITGTLTMTGSILDLSAASPPAGGIYVLATATTGISGTPTTINYNGINGTVSVDSASTPKRLLLTITPTITTSGLLAAVNTTYGTASSTPSSFTVSGANMSAGITVTPPAGFEVSQALGGASGYAGSGTAITVGSSGTIASTTVYVRLAATAAVGASPYSGNIICTSSDATSQNVATVSSSVSKANSSVTAPTAGTYTYNGSPQGPNSGSVATGSTATVTYSYAGSGTTSYSASATQPTNVGSYTVTATVAADSNHNGASSTAVDFNIGMASPTIAFTLNMLRVVTPAAFNGTETSVTIEFAGVPKQTYQIQYSTDLSIWSTAQEVVTGDTGTFEATFTTSGNRVTSWTCLFFRTSN